MFFALPIKVDNGTAHESIPLANGVIVAINVVVHALGWSAYWLVGPGTGLLSVLTYAFAHASLWHLVGNMWVLLVFGNPVNRRLGNGFYTLAYLGSALALGIFARLFCTGYLVGSSGAIFAVMAICVLLMPAARIEIYYLAIFPITLLIGLIQRPKEWVFWFIRWDHFAILGFWAILLIPLLELWGLFWWGWNWTNLGHLLGLVCGVGVVLLLPERITMRNRRRWSYEL